MEPNSALWERCKRVKLLLMDCDGVLTDGRLYFSASGEELKVFDVKDGQGLARWHQAGFESGIISGRGSHKIIKARAEEIGIKYLYTSSSDKVANFNEILADGSLTPEETAYIGDDLGDIALMKIVGLPISVSDGTAIARAAAAYITKAAGGRGAVREVIDMLLISGSRQ